MKKIILGLILLPFALSINAQKGMHAVGANVSYVIINNSSIFNEYNYETNGFKNTFSGGIKYQYYITNFIRFSGTFKYLSTDDETYLELEGFDVSLDSHLFITRPSKIRSYGILGLTTGYQSIITDYNNPFIDFRKKSLFGLNYGLGIQFETNSRITLQIEAIRHLGFPRKIEHYLGDNIGDINYIIIKQAFDNFQISIGAVYNI